MARNIVWLGDTWRQRYLPEAPLKKQAQHLGVLIVLFAFVGLVLARDKLPNGISSRLLAIDSTSRLWFVVVGWGVVAAGALSLVSDVKEIFVAAGDAASWGDVAMNVLIGIIAAMSCGLIHKMSSDFTKG